MTFREYLLSQWRRVLGGFQQFNSQVKQVNWRNINWKSKETGAFIGGTVLLITALSLLLTTTNPMHLLLLIPSLFLILYSDYQSKIKKEAKIEKTKI